MACATTEEMDKLPRPPASPKYFPPPSEHSVILFYSYEMDRCVQWMKRHDFKKVAVQFPEALLRDAKPIANKIRELSKRSVAILGVPNEGSCCVDENGAERFKAEAVIHFGHSCLSPTSRLPVLYIFGAIPVDIPDCLKAFRHIFPAKNSFVILYYEVFYYHAIAQIYENLQKEYPNLVVSKLDVPYNTKIPAKMKDTMEKVTVCQRYFIIPKIHDLEVYSVFYVGIHNRTLTNVMNSLYECDFYLYNPMRKTYQVRPLDNSSDMLKRSCYIDKARNAKVIGILIGTPKLPSYLNAVKHLRGLIKAAGKKSYTLVTGRINVAKLASFGKVEVFVSIGCMKSIIVDCSNFIQPIVSTRELVIALSQEIPSQTSPESSEATGKI